MPQADDGRRELLYRMYDQMFNDINTHILVVWQSVGVLIGAFAVFALVEKQIIPLDAATSLVILISVWLIAHLYDASYWYNRNLVIIANIERQFLERDDLRKIHYYFGRHRRTGAMLTHLRIQYFLGLGVAAIVVYYHFTQRIAPWLADSKAPWSRGAELPYLVLAAAALFVAILRSKRARAYEEFLRNSPGKDIDASEVKYGVGHPVDP